jgi:LysM repeat protein
MKYGVLLSSVMVLALVGLTGCPKTEQTKPAPPVTTLAPGENAPFDVSDRSATPSTDPSMVTSPTTARPATTAKPAKGVTSTKAAPTGENSTTAARPKTYKVKSGDSLDKIAKKFYKEKDLTKAVAAIKKANDIADPNKIKIGQELKLPDLK